MIELAAVAFHYPRSPFALRVDALSIPSGQHVALIGPSGCGKSTLVNLIAGILVPDAGTITVGDVAVSAAGDAERRRFRLANIGFVFQEFELLEYLTVRENVALPSLLAGGDRGTARERAEALATRAGLGDKLRRYPHKLSQGERQRVAICRALLAGPRLIIADEPTGNLDPRTAGGVLELLLAEARSHAATLLVVTHDHGLLGRFERVIEMEQLQAAGVAG